MELEDWLWNPPGNRVILQQGGGWGSRPEGHVADVQDRGQDGWMASSTQWTWVWANSRRLWRTGKPGMLQSMGSQRLGHDWVTEQQDIQESLERRSQRENDAVRLGSYQPERPYHKLHQHPPIRSTQLGGKGTLPQRPEEVANIKPREMNSAPRLPGDLIHHNPHPIPLNHPRVKSGHWAFLSQRELDNV